MLVFQQGHLSYFSIYTAKENLSRKPCKWGFKFHNVAQRFGDHGTKEMLGDVGSKVWPVLNFVQQLPKQGVQTDETCNTQQCCVRWTGLKYGKFCLDLRYKFLMVRVYRLSCRKFQILVPIKYILYSFDYKNQRYYTTFRNWTDIHFHGSVVHRLSKYTQDLRSDAVGPINRADKSYRVNRPYGNDNTKKQWYYWLKEPKWSFCTCGTHFWTFLCRPRQNNNFKWPNLRFWQQRGHTRVNLHFLLPYQFSYRILRPYYTAQRKQ